MREANGPRSWTELSIAGVAIESEGVLLANPGSMIARDVKGKSHLAGASRDINLKSQVFAPSIPFSFPQDRQALIFRLYVCTWVETTMGLIKLILTFYFRGL